MARLFDSETERREHKRLKLKWSRKVDVFAQVSARAVFKQPFLRDLNLPSRAKDYLLAADFDYVVCERETGNVLLLIELDGMGGGHSRDGRYVQKREVPADPYRALKLDRKLEAAAAANIPMVVVSFAEINALTGREFSHTVLDGIIADAVAGPKIYSHVMKQVGEMLDESPDLTRDEVQDLILDAETEAEFMHHPIVRSTAFLMAELPPIARYLGRGMMFLKDRPGFVGMRHELTAGGVDTTRDFFGRAVVSNDLYIRDMGFGAASSTGLVWELGEYCLAAKAHALYGTDRDAWMRAIELALS